MSEVAELLKQLPEYRRQLAEINAALVITPNDAELLKVAADLQDVIRTTEELSRTLSSVAAPTLSSTNGSSSIWQIGQRVMALWEDDGEHYVAQIDGITDSGSHIVTYLDYGTTGEVTSDDIRPYSPAAADSLRPGVPIRAVYTATGLFYDAFVQGFDQSAQMYLVKFVRVGLWK